MKTTIEIADGLLADAKLIAARRKTTVRALVEAGLRRIVEEEQRDHRPFRLRDSSVDGRGMLPTARDASHDEWLDAAYGDRT